MPASDKSVLEYIREKTRDDLLQKIRTYGKCALPRCTGFGKTWILADITTKFPRVLFLYPAKVIKNTAQEVIEAKSEDQYKKEIKAVFDTKEFNFRNIQFMTYYKLARMKEDDINSLPAYDLIIMDECHKCGATLTKKKLKKVIKKNPIAKLIGATATPDRPDAVDIIDEIFDNITVFEYTIHDAFTDGIIQRPIYCYCTYEPKKDIQIIAKEEALTAGEKYDEMIVKEVIKSGLLEISNLYNIPNIMKDVIDTHIKDKSYMKFMAFFSSHKQLNDKLPEVIKWLSEACPGHTVSNLTITTETPELAKNVDRLNDLIYKRNHIDVIACVDMLNQGYHVNDLTGIIMYRGTQSSIIYVQQLGRALSTGSNHSALVFDIVDNLHRKSIFDLSRQAERRVKKTLAKTGELLGIDVSKLSSAERADLKKLLIEESKITEKEEKWWMFCNVYLPEDFIATGHYARYRELIAKLIGETVVERAKRVQEEHRKVWCKVHKIPYPATREEILKHKNTSPELTKVLQWQNISIRQYLDAILPEGKEEEVINL